MSYERRFRPLKGKINVADLETSNASGGTSNFLRADGQWAVPPSTGEANTGSSISTGGIDVFNGKVGVDLQFRGIAAGSSRVSTLYDVANNNVVLDVNEANLSIAETQIPDGSLLARVGDGETITAGWTFSGFLAGSSASFAVSNVLPRILLDETDAPADNGGWYIDANGGQFAISLVNDARSTVTDAIRIDRTGTVVDSMSLRTNTTVTGTFTANSDGLFGSGLSAQGGVSDIGQVGQFAFMDVDGGVGRFGSYNWDTASWQTARLQGSTAALANATADLHYIDANGDVLTTAGGHHIRGAVSSITDAGIECFIDAQSSYSRIASYDWSLGQFEPLRVMGENVDIYNGTAGGNLAFRFLASGINVSNENLHVALGKPLRVYDSTNTDYWEVTHNGTDAIMDLTNTSNLLLTGLPSSGYLQISDGGRFRAYDSTNTDYFAVFDTGSQAQLRTNNNQIYLYPKLVNSMIVGDTAVQVRTGASLQVRDSSNADIAQFQHNGTNFVASFTNTTAWNIDDVPVYFREGNGTRWYDATNSNFSQWDLTTISGYAGIWLRESSPSSSNYAIAGNGSNLILNADTGAVLIRQGLTDRLVIDDVDARFALPIKIAEAAAAVADEAGYGQIWVKNDTPNTLWFTDDAGTDTQLGVEGVTSVVKAANETVFDSATLQDDDDLTLALEANVDYGFRLIAELDTTNPARQLRFAFSVPTGATGFYQWHSVDTGGTSFADIGATAIITATQTAVPVSASSSILVIEGGIVMGGTAGNITFRWAQKTAGFDSTVFKAGSSLTIYKE